MNRNVGKLAEIFYLCKKIRNMSAYISIGNAGFRLARNVEYVDDIFLVGINYDKKQVTCLSDRAI